MTSGGSRIRVLIATTKGPVEIVRVARENPAVRSVVCVDGSLSALPISPAYDAFIREPTGVIERLTGHPVYRADLSAAIDSGTSWQLGFFLAHALAEKGCLAEAGKGAEKTILASGALDRDLNVRAVDHIPEKAGRAEVSEYSGLFLVPASGDLPASSRKWKVIPVATAAEALEACGISGMAGVTKRPVHWPAVPGRHKIWRGFLAAAGVCAVLLIGSGIWVSEPDPATKVAQGSIGGTPSLSIGFRPRGPDTGRCGPVEWLAEDQTNLAARVCVGILRVRGDGVFRTRLSVRGRFLSYVDRARYAREEEERLSPGGEKIVRIDFPYWVRAPLTLEVEVARLGSDGLPDLVVKRSVAIRVPVRDGS